MAGWLALFLARPLTGMNEILNLSYCAVGSQFILHACMHACMLLLSMQLITLKQVDGGDERRRRTCGSFYTIHKLVLKMGTLRIQAAGSLLLSSPPFSRARAPSLSSRN